MSVSSGKTMKYYNYSNAQGTVSVTVIGYGSGDPQRQTILSVDGLYDPLTREPYPAAVAAGLTIKTLAPVVVHGAYLMALAVEANLTLTVRTNDAPPEVLFAAVGNSISPDGSVNSPGVYGYGHGNAQGDNDDNSGTLENGDPLKALRGKGDSQGIYPAATLS
jgi:hypothetical protein